MIDQQTVRLAYRLLLGREPENEAVVEGATEYFDNLDQMRATFVQGAEFKSSLVHMLSCDQPQWILKEMAGALFLPLDLSDKGVSLPILWNSEWEPETTALVLSRLQADAVFVDVGANVGWFSVLAGDHLRRLGGKGQVIAFEAQPEVAVRLQSAIQLSALQGYVDVRAAAVSDMAAVVSVQRRKDGNRGGAYIGPLSADDCQAVVPCIPLDDSLRHISRVDLIKMDIEGSELRALRGGAGVLTRFRPDLIIEINEDMLRQVSGGEVIDLVEFLSGLNYVCVARCGDELQPNGLSFEEIKTIVARDTYPNFLFEPR